MSNSDEPALVAALPIVVCGIVIVSNYEKILKALSLFFKIKILPIIEIFFWTLLHLGVAALATYILWRILEKIIERVEMHFVEKKAREERLLVSIREAESLANKALDLCRSQGFDIYNIKKQIKAMEDDIATLKDHAAEQKPAAVASIIENS